MYVLGLLYVFALWHVLEMAPEQWRVDFAFIPISMEEREMDIEKKFVTFSEQGTKPLTC